MEIVKDMNPASDVAPDAVGEQSPGAPEDPSIVGSLEPKELTTLQSIQQQSMNLQTQIGGLEVRKAYLLGMMQQLKDQGQQILDQASQRLGIKPGEQWSVGPEGIVRRGPVAPPMGG